MEWITRSRVNQATRGTLDVLDADVLPFPAKRAFWIYDVGADATRGQHKHVAGHEILVAVKGSLRLTLKDDDGGVVTAETLSPGTDAAWVKPGSYIEMADFTPDAVLLVLCSHAYAGDPTVGRGGTAVDVEGGDGLGRGLGDGNDASR